MLRKFVFDTRLGQVVTFFAYREVPSTGFSPFKLLYGWPVQGPLDLLIIGRGKLLLRGKELYTTSSR